MKIKLVRADVHANLTPKYDFIFSVCCLCPIYVSNAEPGGKLLECGSYARGRKGGMKACIEQLKHTYISECETWLINSNQYC